MAHATAEITLGGEVILLPLKLLVAKCHNMNVVQMAKHRIVSTLILLTTTYS